MNEKTEDGFVQEATVPNEFPVTRTIRPSVMPWHGRYYMRTRELADVLGLSQPFQFTKDIRKTYGEHMIIAGAKAKFLRTGDDNSKTTFIAVDDAYHVLTEEPGKYRASSLPGQYTAVVSALRKYTCGEE
jgi:hypothetical protein